MKGLELRTTDVKEFIKMTRTSARSIKGVTCKKERHFTAIRHFT